MKVYRANTEQCPPTFYIIAAESRAQAQELARNDSLSTVYMDEIWKIDNLTTDLKIPCIIETFS